MLSARCAESRYCSIAGRPARICCETEWIDLKQRHDGWKAQVCNCFRELRFSGRARNRNPPRRRSRSFVSVLLGSEDVAGIYNILYRYHFRSASRSLAARFISHRRERTDRQGLSGSIDPTHLEQDFRHIPQTEAERVSNEHFPFAGVTDTIEFRAIISLMDRYFFNADIWIRPRPHSSGVA